MASLPAKNLPWHICHTMNSIHSEICTAICMIKMYSYSKHWRIKQPCLNQLVSSPWKRIFKTAKLYQIVQLKVVVIRSLHNAIFGTREISQKLNFALSEYYLSANYSLNANFALSEFLLSKICIKWIFWDFFQTSH